MQSLWIEPFTVNDGQIRYWQIGSMEMWITLNEGCLEIYQRQGAESHLRTLTMEAQTDRPIPDTVTASRIALPTAYATLQFAPLSADRPVVVRPRQPLYVLAKSETCLYLSTPLWLSIRAQPSNRVILEFPLYRPSDTWFGPSTRVGEICYATATRASLQPPQAPTPPHRAFTALHLVNRGNESILLERVNLPIPNLALYQADDASLWTQTVRLEIGGGNGHASLHLQSAPPDHIGRTRRIGDPRERSESNLLKRALSALIS